MALLFCDSFDHYATADLPAKWTTSYSFNGTLAINATGGRRGGGCFRWNPQQFGNGNTGGGWGKTLAPGDANCVLGFALSIPAGSIGAGSWIVVASIRESGSPQVTLRFHNTGVLSVTRGDGNGTLLGTTTASLSFGVFNYIEWKVKIDPSAGTVEIRLNGSTTPALSLTAQNTRQTANTAWTSVFLGMGDPAGGADTNAVRNFDYDDLYVLDGSGSAPLNTFLGDVKVEAQYVTGAGATTGWTPSAGSNWQNIDDAAPNADTDYNAASATNLTDTFVTQDTTMTTIYGVQLVLSHKKSDAGVASLVPVIRQGGVDYPGTAFNPSTGYTMTPTVYPTQPAGGVWTQSAFNAAEFGYKRTA